MKKVVGDIVSSLVLTALTFITTSLVSQSGLLKAPAPLVVTIIVFLISIWLFTKMPEGTISKGISRFSERFRLFTLTLSGKPVTFRDFFDFDGEQVRMVYTCRSRIDKVPCPKYREDMRHEELHKVVQQHIPIDEFFTFQLMFRWYQNQTWKGNHEELMDSSTCTFMIDRFKGLPSKDELLPDGDAWNRSELPDFMYDNLIIIGENSCSQLMLSRLKYILNFYPHFSQIGSIRDGAPTQPKIDLLFMPNNQNKIAGKDTTRLYTSFDKESSNAVAMICYAPNPFNVKKKVLVLYGCHRAGQYLLEEWLHRPNLPYLFRRLIKELGTLAVPFGQIALNAPFESKKSKDFEFKSIYSIDNGACKIPYFPMTYSRQRKRSDNLRIDTRAVGQNPMVDISLVIELSKQDSNIVEAVETFFQKEAPYLQGHYWESQIRDTGLHVTLFEFATRETHETLSEGVEQFTKLEEAISNKPFDVRSPRLSLVGFEVFPMAVTLYADLPINFIDAFRTFCLELLPNNPYFNRLHTPFPTHCTAIRFTKELNKTEQQRLGAAAERFRKHVFGDFRIQTLSFMLTRKQPFQNVERKFELKLDGKG